MDTRKNNTPEPWDNGMYSTGNTRPPKSNGGIIALLLVVVIFLTGIASVLGILNIRLFQQLNAQTQQESVLSFSMDPSEENTVPDDDPAEPAAESDPNGDSSVRLELNKTPLSYENISQTGGLSWQEIYEKNIAAVVSLECTSWDATTTGNGVVLTSGGFLVTNSHVIEDAENITVFLTDGREFEARVVGEDPVSDLAVLRIDAEDLTPAEFGDSDALRVGDAVAAIGDPLGMALRGSMTDGIISAINRDVTVSGRTMTLIQTNAALNSGNSGGPLINCYGQVVGINTMKISSFSGVSSVEGLGFAIPSTTVKEIVDQLIAQGYVSGRPTLGIDGASISTFYQRYYGMPAGLFLTDVDAGSQAEKAGIRAGDILISLDDAKIQDMDALNQALYSRQVGDSVKLVIYRGEHFYTVTLTLEENH